MKYVLDTHTHTIFSGHAYTTWLENVREAAKKGIEVLATTDHGPSMPGGPHIFYFNNLKALPREVEGLIHLRGCEANIMNFKGELDISDSLQQKLDIIIASLHEVCLAPGTREENTQALLRVMDNPSVDIIGHSGNPAFPIFEEEVIKRAGEKNVLIEINNGSFFSRAGSEYNCKNIARLCKKHGVKVVLGSDAHTAFQIGDFTKAHNILQEVEMPEELIMNTNKNKILQYLKNKGKLKDIRVDY